MKIVKLNRRYKQFKEHGHTVALRFDGWDPKASAIEKICKERLTGYGWLPDHDWYHYFGARNSHTDKRPYWITFRNEMDLTLVLLSADLTK
jgi:hypothetical protein